MGNAEAKPIDKAQVKVRTYPQWPEKYAKYADSSLDTGDHYGFPVSRAMVSRENVTFAALFDGCEMGVERGFLPDVTGDGLFEVLMFIHEGKTTENFPDVVDKVYCAAVKFNVSELKHICLTQLLTQISINSVCNTVDLAKKFGLNQLLAESLLFVRHHRQDPQLPWGQLLEFCDGKVLKELVMVAADDPHDVQHF